MTWFSCVSSWILRTWITAESASNLTDCVSVVSSHSVIPVMQPWIMSQLRCLWRSSDDSLTIPFLGDSSATQIAAWIGSESPTLNIPLLVDFKMKCCQNDFEMFRWAYKRLEDWIVHVDLCPLSQIWEPYYCYFTDKLCTCSGIFQPITFSSVELLFRAEKSPEIQFKTLF
jgi:hypothetical protein